MIPKKIHQIWIGNEKLPSEYFLYKQKFELYFPSYEYVLWNNETVKEIKIPDELKSCYYDDSLHIVFKCDVLRYLIINTYGGLYFDIDFEPLKSFPIPFMEFDFLGAKQNNGEIAIGFFGAIKNSNILKKVINNLYNNITICKNTYRYKNEFIYQLSGPEYFNKIVNENIGINDFIFTKEYFYPYWFTECNRKTEDFRITSPMAYAVHHWKASWTNIL